MNAAVIGTAIALVVANVVVTTWVVLTAHLKPKQKLAQSILIWLLPVFGALVVASILFANRERKESSSPHIPAESDYPGVNMGPAHDSHTDQ
jgi:cytochrome bd-type quinol oxidase subunit 2